MRRCSIEKRSTTESYYNPLYIVCNVKIIYNLTHSIISQLDQHKTDKDNYSIMRFVSIDVENLPNVHLNVSCETYACSCYIIYIL